MVVPGTHAHDGWRVAAVRDYARSSDARELDRFNRMVADLLRVPRSLTSLVADDRQLLVGQHGLESWGDVQSMPLSHSLCRHVVERQARLIVEDVRDDPVTRDSLAVRDMKIVAYAGVPLVDAKGRVLGALCAIDDTARVWVPEEVARLEDLAALAMDQLELQRLRGLGSGKDPLTGLLTRGPFVSLVERSLAMARRTTVLALDVTGLHLVNDAFGHSVGDQLLAAAAERLTASVRETDRVCRLAGDRFVVLSDAPGDEAAALRMAERLRLRMSSDPLDLDGRPYSLSMSVGVASTNEVMDPEELVETAVTGLRRAKDGIGRSVRLASSEATRQACTRLSLRAEIAGAHERGETHLVYQPVIDVHSGKTVAVEALMRWTHPQFGPVSPTDFVPAAELSGAIIGLGEWVIHQACADLARWRTIPGAEQLVVGVNVAPIQLTVPSLPVVVAEALSAAGLPHSALGLEITERTLLAEGDQHRRGLEELHAGGVRVAIDDFGTGYSALSYLTRFPVDVLKIDRSFVARMTEDARAATLIGGLLGLARELGMQTVAEGVETVEQHEHLVAAGFDWAQGFLFCRPVGAGEIARLLTG